MRGRKSEVLAIHSPDVPELERIAHSDASPWYQVRRARIVLGIAAGQRREDLAVQLECDESTIWRACQRYRDLGLAGLLADHRQGHSGRDLGIAPVQRAQIVELACLEPVAKGLHITHWSSEDLARQAVADGIVARISPRTVRTILTDVDLQPHRTCPFRKCHPGNGGRSQGRTGTAHPAPPGGFTIHDGCWRPIKVDPP